MIKRFNDTDQYDYLLAASKNTFDAAISLSMNDNLDKNLANPLPSEIRRKDIKYDYNR